MSTHAGGQGPARGTTVDDLREVIDLWADPKRGRARRSRRSSELSGSWAEDQDQVLVLAGARSCGGPERPEGVAPTASRARMRGCSTPLGSARDRVGAASAARPRYPAQRAHRRSGLVTSTWQRGRITVFGKGQKSRVIPLRGRVVLGRSSASLGLRTFRSLDRLHRNGRLPALPREGGRGGRTANRVRDIREADECPDGSPMVVSPRRGAGLVGAGMTSGLNMHRARHTFATDLRRVAGSGRCVAGTRAFRPLDHRSDLRPLRPERPGARDGGAGACSPSNDEEPGDENVSIDRLGKRLY